MITLPWQRKPKAVAGRWPLDLEICNFSGKPWTLEDAYQGLLILGSTGSGKTSGPAAGFSRKLLEHGFGGLVLCYEKEEKHTWVQRMRDAGREADIRIFGLDQPWRLNFLGHESKQEASGLDAIDNLVNLLLNVCSPHRTPPTGNDLTWFTPQKKALIRSSLSLLLLAEEPLTLKAISRLLQSAPKTVEQGIDLEWRKTSYFYDLFRRALAKNPDHPELTEVHDYWFQIRAAMADKNRAPIDAEYAGLVSGPLSRGNMAALFSNETNLTPDDCFGGKVIIVDLPVSVHEEAGQYCALIWLVSFMRAAMRRVYNPPCDRPVFVFADESNFFSTDHDANFFSTCRKHGICNVRLAQNLPGFIKSYGGGEQAKLGVNQALGNLVTKLFLRNDEPDTNAWASRLIAKETIFRPSLSSSATGGSSVFSTSMAEVELPSCSEKEFLTLRNGGKKNNYTVDGILFQAGRLWDGERWITAQFPQSR